MASRKLTPNKERILATVASYPGKNASAIASLTGILPCGTQRILNELSGTGQVYYELQKPSQLYGRRWYRKNSFGDTLKHPESIAAVA